MPWQPFTPDSGQRKTLREDSPDSLASREEGGRFRRRPSYLEEFSMQVGLSRDIIVIIKIMDYHLFSPRRGQRRMEWLSLHQKQSGGQTTPRSEE